MDDIQNVILYLRSRGIGILITDHNVRETLGVTDRAYIMFLDEGTVEVITGVNLPMVIKLATSTGNESLPDLARKICDQGRQGIYLAGALLAPPAKGGAD